MRSCTKDSFKHAQELHDLIVKKALMLGNLSADEHKRLNELQGERRRTLPPTMSKESEQKLRKQMSDIEIRIESLSKVS